MPSGPSQYGLPPRASSRLHVGAVVQLVGVLLPSTHVAHAELLAPAAYVPAAHAVQNVALPRPNVPAGHAVQPAAVADGTQYVPGLQQTAVPASVHCRCCGAVQVPAAHAKQTFVPPVEYVPAAQTAQGAVNPTAVLNVPDAHSVQALSPVAAVYVPAAHALSAPGYSIHSSIDT